MIFSNKHSNHGFKFQWMISSWTVTYLSEWGECSYLIGIGFRSELWWVGIARVRCWEDELGFGKTWVVFMEGLGVVGLSWKALKLKNCISVFGGSRWFCNRVFLDVQGWFQSGTPSTIYREGDRVDWRENEGSLLQKGWSSKMGQKWNLVGNGCSLLVCNSIPFCLCYAVGLLLVRPRWTQHKMMQFCIFAILGNFELCTWYRFSGLWGFHTKVEFQTYHITICNVLEVKWDQIEVGWDLGKS